MNLKSINRFEVMLLILCVCECVKHFVKPTTMLNLKAKPTCCCGSTCCRNRDGNSSACKTNRHTDKRTQQTHILTSSGLRADPLGTVGPVYKTHKPPKNKEIKLGPASILPPLLSLLGSLSLLRRLCLVSVARDLLGRHPAVVKVT